VIIIFGVLEIVLEVMASFLEFMNFSFEMFLLVLPVVFFNLQVMVLLLKFVMLVFEMLVSTD